MKFKSLMLAAFSTATAACGQLQLNPALNATGSSPSKGNATMSPSAAPASQTQFSLSAQDGCQKNESDLLTVQLGGQSDGIQVAPQIVVMVKGLRSTPADYICSQKPDNIAKAATPSDFDGCAVSLGLRSSNDPLKFDLYNIFRTQTQVGPFQYSGTCSVKISKTKPVEGTFNCTQLTLTHTAGTPISRIDPDNALTVSGSFGCLER